MTVLVTGGNGFVGHHLVSALLDRGDQVRVLALPTEDTSWLEERGVDVRRGDLCRPDTLAGCAEGVDGVVHLAAMMDVWRPLRDYRAVNVDGTEHVARAAMASGVRRFVHMSSSSVYGVAPGRTVDETVPLLPFDDPYPVTKAEGDHLVRRLAAEEGLPAVILRPDQVFGPGDRLHFGRTAERVRAGTAIVVGSGDNAMPLVYVSDIVQGLLLALDHERAIGQVFNITNDEPLTQLGFLEAIATELGVGRPRIRVPARALYAAAWAAERAALAVHTSRRPPLTRLGVAFAATDVRFSIDKARRELGYAPGVPLREGVRLAAAWHIADAAGGPGSASVSRAGA